MPRGWVEVQGYMFHLPSTVSIIDVFLGERLDRERQQLSITTLLCRSGNGRLSALCNDDSSGALGVFLGELSDLLGNLRDIGDSPRV